MSSSYSPDLRIELIGNGEQSGVWGTTTNNNLGTLIEDAIAGLANVSVNSANQALTAFDGVADQARCAAINLTTTTVAPFNIYVPPVPKLYVVINSSAYAATIYASSVIGNTTPAGAGVSLAANSSCFVRCDGTNIRDSINHISGTLFVESALTLGSGATVADNLTVSGSTLLGTSQNASITTASPAVVTVVNSPKNNTFISFTTSGTLPTGITAGEIYRVANRTATTFNVATLGGSVINASGSQSGTHVVSAVAFAATAAPGANTTQIATTAFVRNAVNSIPGGATYQTLVAATAATTANISLSGTQTIDVITVSVGDRVLVKNQTAAQDNGVYVVAAGAWARSTDANTAAKVAAAQVPVLQGTTNGGKTFITSFKSDSTLGVTAMPWDFLITGTSPTITTPTITTPTITTPAISGAVMTTMASSVLTSRTSQSATGTAVDFTSIPSWVKRITIMLSGVSTNGTARLLAEVGTSSGIVATGYLGSADLWNNSPVASLVTQGLGIGNQNSAAYIYHAVCKFTNITGNTWVGEVVGSLSNTGILILGSTTIALSGTLDRVRITNGNGTTTGIDAFDAGTINILYE